ncbi:MAG: hypothetical protein R3261_13065 [Alphaproteobacteria bacterium]|nr:hypothetical protein [Alphaproteobacteria bacterium]
MKNEPDVTKAEATQGKNEKGLAIFAVNFLAAFTFMALLDWLI